MDEALGHYLRDANSSVALGFVDDLQATDRLIAEHPASGSLRYAYELQMADLRSLRLKRYPIWCSTSSIPTISTCGA